MPMMIPRCCIGIDDESVVLCSLLGFCDAFKDAYAAVVYLKVDTKTNSTNHFLCAKTRVAPVKRLTIPRLELLSALLLAQLILVVRQALEEEIELMLAIH